LKKDVIVIGGDHSNTLGVVRSLGLKGVNVYLIVTSPDISFVAKSKFVVKKWIVNENEKSILEILAHLKKNTAPCSVIITTSDFATEVIDKNLNDVSINFECANINKTQGEISFFMNKCEMFRVAEKVGLNVPKFWVIELDYMIDNQLECVDSFPCIVKPLASVEGGKEYIKKIENKKQLFEYLNYVDSNLSKIMVQEYVQSDDEVMLELIGFVDKDGEINIPGIIKKIRKWPDKNGSLSYAKFSKNNFNINFELIRAFFCEIGYRGLFDFEFKYVNGIPYFIENNFRIGGTNYAYTKSGANLPYSWLMDESEISLKSKNDKREIKIINEITDFKQILLKKISIVAWLKDLIKADVYHYYDRKDLKPFIYALYYKFKNSLTK
jgi:predicted ATP-grasp superfamily ATP-dependent carboligase